MKTYIQIFLIIIFTFVNSFCSSKKRSPLLLPLEQLAKQETPTASNTSQTITQENTNAQNS